MPNSRMLHGLIHRKVRRVPRRLALSFEARYLHRRLLSSGEAGEAGLEGVSDEEVHLAR